MNKKTSDQILFNPLLVFTCGGTGGHVYPAIALAQELSEYSCHFVGTSDREDHRIVGNYGFAFTAIGDRLLTITTLFPMFLKSCLFF